MKACNEVLEAGADLQSAVEKARPGSVLCLAPGRYTAALRPPRSVELRATGDGVVLDAGDAGRVLQVSSDDLRVVLEGIRLTGGNAREGGAVEVSGFSEVVLRDCTLSGNRARGAGGGALLASAGRVRVQRCRIEANQGGAGSAILATQVASVLLQDSLVDGTPGGEGAVVSVQDGAALEVLRSTVLAGRTGTAISACGTTSRSPEVTVSDSILQGRTSLENDGLQPAKIRVQRSVLGGEVGGVEELDASVVRGDPRFAGSGPRPLGPAEGSPAIGLALGGGATDLTGRPRPDRQATAGAFER